MSRRADEQTPVLPDWSGKSRSRREIKLVPSSEIKSVKDLQVYQMAYANAKKLHGLSLQFPKIEQYGGMADQLRRGSKSICANLAEGFAKKSLSIPEFKRFLNIAYGSSEEVLIWLDFSKDLDYINQRDFAQLTDHYNQISKMLYSLIKKWGQN